MPRPPICFQFANDNKALSARTWLVGGPEERSPNSINGFHRLFREFENRHEVRG